MQAAAKRSPKLRTRGGNRTRQKKQGTGRPFRDAGLLLFVLDPDGTPEVPAGPGPGFPSAPIFGMNRPGQNEKAVRNERLFQKGEKNEEEE